MNTQSAPSTLPSTKLRWKKIHMYGLDMDYRQFTNTPEDKFQDQLTLIRLVQKNISTINDTKMINKSPNNNT